MGSQNSTCRNSIEVAEKNSTSSNKKSAIRSTVDEDANVVGLVANSERCDYDPNAQSSFTSADKSFIQAKGDRVQTKTRPGLMVSYNTIIAISMTRCISK